MKYFTLLLSLFSSFIALGQTSVEIKTIDSFDHTSYLVTEAFSITAPFEYRVSNSNDEWYVRIAHKSNSGSRISNSINDISKLRVKAYPNPANQKLNVDIPKNSKSNLRITSLSGQVLLCENELNDSIKLDISSFKSGVYLLIISNNKSFITTKFIVEK